MDLLDQRLTDAGTAWRQIQPEPPDLDRMVVALRRQRSGLFTGRLMYAFVAGLLLVAAIAVAPGVGSILHQLQPTTPPLVTTPTASPTPSTASPEPSTASPKPSPSATSDREVATVLVHKYEDALVSGNWQGAFDLLAPTSRTREQGVEAFASEREPFFVSVDGRYAIGEPSRVSDWSAYAPDVVGADRTRAWLIEVDYPALAGNNAGYEQFIVAPDPGGTWRIWQVR